MRLAIRKEGVAWRQKYHVTLINFASIQEDRNDEAYFIECIREIETIWYLTVTKFASNVSRVFPMFSFAKP
jgi:hypothetical protein